jgi:hypothetical protein
VAKRINLRPRSVPEFLKLVEALQRKAGYSLWYRGCGRETDKLLPSLYRHPLLKQASEFVDLERQLMTRFRQRSIPYHARELRDELETLFFMQHYGVPTRLLDWTENPLIALHFALMSAPCRARTRGARRYKEAAAVWILDPHLWNRSALSHITYKGGPLAQGDEALNGYSPSTTGSIGKYPVALYGAHNSARIVAQQGVFTIFGGERAPMEKLIGHSPFNGRELIKVSILAVRIAQMRKSLLNHGMTESVVFPDLEGLARETKRHFGFEA